MSSFMFENILMSGLSISIWKCSLWLLIQLVISDWNCFSVLFKKYFVVYMGRVEKTRCFSQFFLYIMGGMYGSIFVFSSIVIIYFLDNYCTHVSPSPQYMYYVVCTALNKCLMMSIFLFGFWISPKLSSFRGVDFVVFTAFKFICGIQNSSRL